MLFYPDGWLYLLSMDGTFLNNEVQFCMYPANLNMWGAAGHLIIPIVCLFVLNTLRVLLMRLAWYSPGLFSMALSPFVHLLGTLCKNRPSSHNHYYHLSGSSSFSFAWFKSLFLRVRSHYAHQSSAPTGTPRRGRWQVEKVEQVEISSAGCEQRRWDAAAPQNQM